MSEARKLAIVRNYGESRLTSEFWPDAKWQVVFRLDGLDYCREPRPRDWTIEQVEAWVSEQCRIHELDGAVIQFW